MTKYILDKVNVKTITDWEVDITEYPNKLSLMLADMTEVYDKTLNDYLKSTIDSYNGECLDPFLQKYFVTGIVMGAVKE